MWLWTVYKKTYNLSVFGRLRHFLNTVPTCWWSRLANKHCKNKKNSLKKIFLGWNFGFKLRRWLFSKKAGSGLLRFYNTNSNRFIIILDCRRTACPRCWMIAPAISRLVHLQPTDQVKFLFTLLARSGKIFRSFTAGFELSIAQDNFPQASEAGCLPDLLALDFYLNSRYSYLLFQLFTSLSVCVFFCLNIIVAMELLIPLK